MQFIVFTVVLFFANQETSSKNKALNNRTNKMRNYSGARTLAKTERNTQADNRKSFSSPLNPGISLGWTSQKGYPFPAFLSAIFYQLRLQTCATTLEKSSNFINVKKKNSKMFDWVRKEMRQRSCILPNKLGISALLLIKC